jgi:hypothetical protein
MASTDPVPTPVTVTKPRATSARPPTPSAARPTTASKRKFFLDEEEVIPFKYVKVSGVLITRIFHDERLVALVVEGAYLARTFLTGKMTAPTLERVAPGQNLKPLKHRGRFLSQSDAMEALKVKTLPEVFSIAPYILSNTTYSLGKGSVLLFGVTRECNASFEQDVATVIQKFFQCSRQVVMDSTTTDDALTEHGLQEAKQAWNDASPWTVTEHVFHLENTQHDEAIEALLTYEKKR